MLTYLLQLKNNHKHHYPPEATPVEKPYGTPVTDADIKEHVTVPGFPAEGEQPKVTVDEGAQLPDGNTAGSSNVPVTVTYPDGTTAHVDVPVTIGEQAQAITIHQKQHQLRNHMVHQ